MTMSNLLKRDDMGYSIPPPVIVLLIMFGAGCFTCMGYAVHKLWGFGQDGNGLKPVSVAQMEYMTEVRVRNLNAMEIEGRIARAGKGRY